MPHTEGRTAASAHTYAQVEECAPLHGLPLLTGAGRAGAHPLPPHLSCHLPPGVPQQLAPGGRHVDSHRVVDLQAGGQEGAGGQESRKVGGQKGLAGRKGRWQDRAGHAADIQGSRWWRRLSACTAAQSLLVSGWLSGSNPRVCRPEPSREEAAALSSEPPTVEQQACILILQSWPHML